MTGVIGMIFEGSKFVQINRSLGCSNFVKDTYTSVPVFEILEINLRN